MEANSAKERARLAAAARNKPQARTGLSGRIGRAESQGNQLTSYNEDTSGWKLSPSTVMVICLFYIGSVVVLHIFGKVKGASSAMGGGATGGAGAGDEGL
jgi:preprotein translocase subunit Sec61beta